MGTANRLNLATTNHRLGRSSRTTIDRQQRRYRHRTIVLITQRHLRHQRLYSRPTWCSLPQPTNFSTSTNHRR